MVQTVQIIRDVISINANINFMVGLEPGDTLRLIARQINLLETCDLKGRNLELYASTFVASNDSIFLDQGEPGAPGGVGTNGAWGSKASGKRNGSDGGAGNPGGNGTNGGTVKVIAEVISGLQVNVRGGDGGKGGQGGYGGKGDTETVSLDRPSPIIVLNPSGGNGGRGGNGGNGGQGGTVTTSSVNYITEPIVDVLGGRFGGKGSGGGYGGAGDVEYIPQRWPTDVPPDIEMTGEDGNDGPFGADGADGLAGSISKQVPSYAELWSALASEAFASEWAKYRHAVGEFFFRSYVPEAVDRDQYIGMAVDEFQAALRLNPNQTESTFRLEQIWNDINPLGLPRKFDVIPDFKDYINGFRELSNLNATFMNIGNTLVLKSTDLQNFQDIFKSQEAQSVNRIKEATNDLEISQKNETDIQRALEETKKMIEDVKQQIDKAKEEMKKKPMTFGEIVGDVGQLAVAVSAVMAAAPTGGASLLVLAPDIISFSSTVYNSAEPLVKAILDHHETQTLTVAKDKYDKVKKDVDDISNASKKLTNLLTVIDTIKNTKTADNSKLLGLVQKGAELAYEYLLKDQELKRAQMRSRALGEKLTAEGELLKFHQAAVARTEIEDPQVVREAGLQIIKAALFRVDILLGYAFRAQRSIEIYLLKDQTQNVFYDVGRVKPDLEADYRRDSELAVTLTSAYQESFAKLLDITAMEETYLKYFDQTLQSDTLRLSFTDPEDLSKFRSTFTLTFSLDAGTLSKERFHTKIQAVGVAFIGATGEGDLVSCRIEHGGVYSERVSSVEVESTILRARHETILASITPLEEISFGASSPPLNETQSSPLWALGIGGLYTITIPDGEFELHHPTFEGLTRIQVWFGYQFKE